MAPVPGDDQINASPAPRQRKGSCLGRAIKFFLLLGVLGGAAGGLGAWWLWRYVHQELAPQVERQLGQILQRPVELGELERVTPTGLRFGPSTIPATEAVGDRLTTEGVSVSFNPAQLLATGGQLDLNVTLEDPNLYLEQAADGTWLSTELNLQPSDGPLEIRLKTLRLDNGEVTAVPYGQDSLLPNAAVDLENVRGQLTTQAGGERLDFDAEGDVVGQTGSLRTSGQAQLAGPARATGPEIDLKLKGQSLLIADVKRLLENTLPLPQAEFDQGRLDADLNLSFAPDQPPGVSGRVSFRDAVVKVPQLPQKVENIAGSLTIDDLELQLKRTTGRYGPFEIQTQGLIDLAAGYDLTAQVEPFELPAAIDYLKIALPTTVTGRAKGENIVVSGALNNPLFEGRLVNIGRLLVDDKVPFESASSRFRFQDSEIGPVIDLREMRAVPMAGGLITGSGEIRLGSGADPGSIEIEASAKGLNGDDLAALYSAQPLPFRVGSVNAQSRVAGSLTGPTTTVRFQALEADYPTRGLATIANGRWDFQDVLVRVAGGIARGGGELVGDQWRGRAQLAGIQLDQVSTDLRGDLNGDVSFSGPVSGLSPAAIAAEGIVTFTQGLSIIQEPLTARFRWDKDKIVVGRASAAGFEGQGLVYVDLTDQPEVTGFDLAVEAEGLELASLPDKLGLDLTQFPLAIALGGLGNFSGQLSGTPSQPQLRGDLALRQFAFNNLPFESSLDGSLSFGPAGTNLQLAGQQDRIALNLDSDLAPRSFQIRQGEAIARGQRIGPDQLRVNLDDFSLAILDFKPASNISAIGNEALKGIASGEVIVGLSPFTAEGSLQVLRPSLGTLRGDRFSGDFSLRDNVAVLRNAALLQGPSRYAVSGRSSLGSDPQFDIKIAIADGDTRNILQTLQWFDFDDVSRGLAAPTYATAADLRVNAVGLPEEPLITQLRRFSEVKTLVVREARRRREEARIPALAELTGQFDGSIDISGSLSQGLKAEFQLAGEDWDWGYYDLDKIIVQGEFADDVITFQPVRVEAKETVISLTGQFGGEIQQSGQLRAENVPVSVARNFIELPVALTGNIDMEATVAGTASNPQAIGRINLENGTLNGTPVRTRQTGFNYVNARLGFGGSIEVDGPEPVRISGSIPYAFPFSEVQPENEQIQVNLSVKDEGLAFLDLITRNQLQWLDGKGEVRLSVGGTLSNPEAEGVATFEQASIAAQFLPDAPLSQVTGRARFVGDRIFVDGLQGLFSDGTVSARGIIPISDPSVTTDEPLQVSFTDLNLNLRGLYRGGASGDVLVQGTALSPDLAGEIRLMNGQVLLPDSNTVASTAGAIDDAANTAAPADGGIAVGSGTIAIAPPSFNNLRLRLGENVRVEQAPLFSFLAQGDLSLIGNLETPLLDGAIALTRGQVNLFTSQFALAQRAQNVAIFNPEDGIDPLLRLTMATAVTETSRRRSAFETTSTSEIQDTNPADFGSLQTVRIRAEIEGPASQLLDNITLSSSPNRSQAEIVALIGGGFVDTLGRGGDSTLALANLAGSALLGNLQGAINSVLTGPVELRLFPTVVESTRDRKEQADGGSTDREDSSAVFALGAEVGVNINNSTSFSALRLLTVDLPTQYNLRYQLNDSLNLRGTTDLKGDNRFVVDYEARF